MQKGRVSIHCRAQSANTRRRMWKRTGDDNDTGLAGDALGGPGKVTRVETQGTVLVVAAAGADDVDALGADTSVGGLATKLEGSLLPCTQQLSEMFAFLLCVEQAQNARGRFPTGLSPPLGQLPPLPYERGCAMAKRRKDHHHRILPSGPSSAPQCRGAKTGGYEEGDGVKTYGRNC